jgi:hypothetical protein
MSETKVITGKVRFSYAQVFEPKAMNESSTPKYSVSLIVSKKDKKTLDKIKDAIESAIEEGKTSKWGGKVPKNLKTPLRDGDEEREDDEVYAGAMFVNANSSNKPGLVDEDLNPILDKSEFYSGCYGRASINFYAYDSNGSKGIACGLNNIQKLEDGVRLAGGGASAEEDFGKEDDDLM